MSTLWTALALATVAGMSIPAGAWLATFQTAWPEWLKSELRHGVVAFGAGALLAAVALVLLPDGTARLQPWPAIAWFFAGAVFFSLVDKTLAERGGRSSQFIAMMMDYLPEAMALGALITVDVGAALLVAGLIALQNIPESFNAMREMSEKQPVSLWYFALMVPLGPLAAFAGLSLPSSQDAVIGAIMLFASGGIVFLMFQDIAPQVPLENTTLPTFGAILGFGVGLAGDLLI